MKNKSVITNTVLAVIAILALLFGYNKTSELTSLTDTVTTLQAQKSQLESYSDSLFHANSKTLEQVQSLALDNSQLKTLNSHLSRKAAAKQRVKYVTTSTSIQHVKDTLDALFNKALYERLTADALREELQLQASTAQEREDTLWQHLSECYNQIPHWPLEFVHEDPYLQYSIYIDNDSSLILDLKTRDTLSFAHTTQRTGFLGLGPKKYNVFAQSTSPYSLTKTHSYTFRRKAFLKKD